MMRLNCAEFHSKEPTEGMIIDLIRKNEKEKWLEKVRPIANDLYESEDEDEE